MKHTPDPSNIDSRLLMVLLKPSWGSAITAVVLSVGLIIASIALASHQVSFFKSAILEYQATRPRGDYHSLSSHFLSNSLIANLPLLLFWALIGLVVYLFAENALKAIRDTAELHQEMNYVHANRKSILVSGAKHLLIRLVVLVVWAGYIIFFFHQILPYCIAAAVAGSNQSEVVQNSLYILLAIAIMTVALHIHTVLFRLLLLRPRVFSRQLYID